MPYRKATLNIIQSKYVECNEIHRQSELLHPILYSQESVVRALINNDNDQKFTILPSAPYPFYRFYRGSQRTLRYLFQILTEDTKELKLFQIGSTVIDPLIQILRTDESITGAFSNLETLPLWQYTIDRHNIPFPVQQLTITNENSMLGAIDIHTIENGFLDLRFAARSLEQHFEQLTERHNEIPELELACPPNIQTYDWDGMTPLEREYHIREEQETALTNDGVNNSTHRTTCSCDACSGGFDDLPF